MLPLSHNDSGEQRRFSVIEQIQDKWESIGILLGFQRPELDTVQQQYNRDAIKCLTHITEKWIRKSSKVDRYNATWDGLAKLLRDIDELPMANELDKLLYL